ncbi:MAG: hypothetical protein JWM37_58 [Candidatus Saccharibacteria bacterium]|nr:hypothetical protein [Candidatus Saccharibacteria bacterium]
MRRQHPIRVKKDCLIFHTTEYILLQYVLYNGFIFEIGVTVAYEKIGIAGTSASGKDTAADHLAELGYLHVSTAEIIRQEAQRLYGNEDQYVLRKVGHELRQRQGPAATCLLGLSRYMEQRHLYRGVVISGFRAVAPAQAIRDVGGVLLAIDAPPEIRYQRQVGRARPGESRSYEEFLAFEEEELAGTLSTGQDIRGVQRISDVQIYNDGDLPTFLRQVETAVGLDTSTAA